jgi:hypothetical protein
MTLEERSNLVLATSTWTSSPSIPALKSRAHHAPTIRRLSPLLIAPNSRAPSLRFPTKPIPR